MIASQTSLDQVEFKIVSQSFDCWNVQFRLNVSELVDQKALLHHLRSIKVRIARMQSLLETCMVFDGILHKERTDDFVDVIVRIRKIEIEKGNPHVHFTDNSMPDGTSYSRMTALLDLFCLDQFEKPITERRIMQAAVEAGIPKDMLDTDLIATKLKEVLDNQQSAKNIPIARGTFPDVGRHAEVEFFFQAAADADNLDLYYSSRRVSKGDPLCHKIAATCGDKPGMNAVGETLPPRPGLDIALKADSGAVLSIDAMELAADTDGVAVISRAMTRRNTVSGRMEFPEAISVKVNPVLRIEGNQLLDIATNKTVEIIGDLIEGSRILTNAEVYVEGDVEQGTVIQAAEDVIVGGSVNQASLNSDGSVVVRRDVSGSRLAAKNQVIIGGSVNACSLTGGTIQVRSLARSNLVARKSVTVDIVESDENNVLSTICVGMSDFFKQRIEENCAFLEKARANLAKIEILAGNEIMAEINAGNVQTMVLKFLARYRAGNGAHNRKYAQSYRTLLESIMPTRALVAQKTKENEDLKRRIEEENSDDDNMIIVRERMSARALVNLSGVQAGVDRLDAPVKLHGHPQTGIMIDSIEKS